MEFGKIVLGGGRQVSRWVAERWNALVAPAETTAKKKAEVLLQLWELAKSADMAKRRQIDWKMEVYEKLGLIKDKKIRSQLLAKIEKCEDPLSILIRLVEAQAVLDIHASEDGGEIPPKTPAASK